MSVFADENGREWRLRITRFHVVRLRDDYGVDLDQAMLSYEGLAREVFDDTGEKAVRALWFLCEAQAKERSVDADGFAMLLGGDVLEAARQALVEELGNFSQRSPIGAVMKNEKNRRAFMAKVTAEIDQRIAEGIARLSQAD